MFNAFLRLSMMAWLFPISALAQGNGQEKAIQLQLPRIAVSMGKTQIKNIPENIRIVSEYNRPNNEHILPMNTGGTLTGYSVGIGLVLLHRIELAFDLVHWESYFGGRDTWSEIGGFPSDDYVGYRYNGKDRDLSAGYRFLFNDSREACGYFKAGFRFHDNAISVGADAYGEFHTQNSMSIKSQSYLLGVGYKTEVTPIEWGFEFEFSNSFDDTPMVRSYFVSFVLNIVPWGVL